MLEFLYGLLGGVLRVLLGYNEAIVKSKDEKFSLNKAIVSVLLGGVLGLAAKPVMIFLQVPQEFVDSSAANGLIVILAAFAVYGLEDIAPALIRRVREVLPLGK